MRKPILIAALICGLVATSCDEGRQPKPSVEPAKSLRIVSISPTATEMLFSIGAGDRLIAVDDQSNFPSKALRLPHDLSGFQPSVEAIAAYDPDLVLAADASTGEQLASLGIRLWVGPAAKTLDDVYSQMTALGAITGHESQAAERVQSIRGDIAELVDKVSDLKATGLSYYHELDNTLYSVTSTTFIGQVYAMFGLTNIADDAADAAGSGYPQLSSEFVVEADPDLIFLADGELGESPESVRKRPGWSQLAAVQNGHVFVVDADTASRWGPRVVDFITAISDSLTATLASA